MGNLARALQGFGAGVAGRGTAFSHQLMLEEKQREELDENRRKAALLDNRRTLFHLTQNRPDMAEQVLVNRLDAIDRLGGNTMDTQATLEQLRSGDMAGVIQELKYGDDAAVAAGMLEPFSTGPTIVKGGDIDDMGQYALKNPDGTITRGQIEGWQQKGDEQKDKQPLINTHRKTVNDMLKSFREVDVAYNKVSSAGKRGTAAGDMSLIFNFMKMNDPTSTVRESEFSLAQHAGGWPERFKAMFKQAADGQLLDQTIRDDLVAQAEALYQAQRLGADIEIENVLELADQDSINRERILGTNRLRDYNSRVNTPSMMATALPSPRKVSMKEVRDTARKRGIPVQQVMRDMGIR